MFRQFVALVRGKSYESAEAALAPHGMTILRQQIRDSAAAVAAARRAVAVAIAQNSQEKEQYERIVARIDDLESRTTAALEQGHAELAREAAETIAQLEAERDVSAAAQQRFLSEIERLKRTVNNAEARLREIQRGERLAAATQATQRMRAAAPSSGLSTLQDAEQTLSRLRQRQLEIDATAAAMEEMELSNDPAIIVEKLASAGCGAPLKSSADDVLARLAQRLKPAAA